ncbi:DUF4886 domain-containing protein [Gramella sp. AN32]|uniref:DUF4886 domain-containing protein n=1 Tax=Christiangramia antarctica TaxID=2058158 RepID=A0ABW5X161_9FLAO|nr:DUF4886 domain-containing protein [Gramella sp. AN32]MCM4157216.1 hypothetical protein [Gramella sp. AN32]
MKISKSFNRFSYVLIVFLSMLFTFTACEEDEVLEPEREVALNLEYAHMTVGNDLVLTPLFGNIQSPMAEYKWEVSDSTVIEISSVAKNYAATIKAIGEGTATATIKTLDGSEQASTTIETNLIRETEVRLPESITAYTQSTVTITPDFNLVDIPTRNYTWSASPENIISFETNPETYEVVIQGLTTGTTELTISSEDGGIVGTTTVTVEDENDGILKVLAIGNSFSEDAIEYYLYGLANAAGEEIVIGNLYIGGAELALHAQNATDNSDNYSYRKINLQGNKTTTSDVSIATALADENWDYISFQQTSSKSGQYETFTEPLLSLYEYVAQNVDNPHTKYLLHQTWAYAQNSTHSGFVNYDNDQITMYEAIVDAYSQAEDLITAYSIVPSGTAIQNARTSYLGDNFNRDGYHLNEIGRYTAASTWFEILFNESVVDNSYMPDGFVPIDLEIAQHAAHEAVQTPDMVTELTEYQSAGGTGVITKNVYIDFAASSNSTGWNGMTSHIEGSTIPNLKYEDNEFTGIEMMITSRFNGQNTSGETDTSTDFNMPADVSGKSYFGNSKREWSGRLIEKGVIKLSGFEGDSSYEFCFFGSRTATDNRETKYTVIGEDTNSAVLNTASNTDQLACVQGVKPNSDGEIIIEVSAGPNNDNSYGFFYINAMRIAPE